MAESPPPTPPSEERLEQGVRANLPFDLPAGLVVFLVALPLCLGIALASDAPLLGGLISGLVGGVIVGALSASDLSVSGPAAGLAALVAEGIVETGSYEALCAATVLAGALQLGLGYLRAGAIAGLFPNSVVKGMLAGIGLIIVLKQIPHGLGRDRDLEGDEAFWNLVGDENTFTALLHALYAWTPGAAMICGLALAILLAWEMPAVARTRVARVVPGSLVAVTAGTLLNELFLRAAPDLAVTAENGHLVQIPGSGPSDMLQSMTTADFSALANPATLKMAVVIAAVASVETLLSLEAADKLDPFKRSSNPNRELLAQGVGNVVSGLLGGLPITSVVVRTSANVQNGARTRVAAIVHGLLLLASVLFLSTTLNHIPLAALAAVLILVGYKLANIALFKKMWALGPNHFLPFLVTVVAVVFTDLLTGVGLGLVVGMAMVIRSNYRGAITVVNEGQDWLIRFATEASFVNKVRLRQELARVPDGANVLIDGGRAQFIDHDLIEQIDDFRANARFRGITVEVRGIHEKDNTRAVARGA
jgi:MFS superfamily sulfate permease-like transporter